MDFDPTLLRTFVAVKEAGGFSRAARQLHLTQSAVSHQIRRLEEHAGRPLLYRTTRSLALTDDGEDFLRHAKQVLLTLDGLNQRFRPSPVSGVVRFGVLENFMGERLPTILGQFARAFPAVRLDVSVNPQLDLRALVAAGELDLAVVLRVAGSDAPGVTLRQTQLVWASAETFEPPSRASLPLAFSPAPCIHREVGAAALDRAAIEWHTVFTSHSQQGLRAAVLAGLAVAVLSRQDLETGMKIVDSRFGLPPLPKADFTLIYGNGQTEAVLTFGKMIEEMGPGRATARP